MKNKFTLFLTAMLAFVAISTMAMSVSATNVATENATVIAAAPGIGLVASLNSTNAVASTDLGNTVAVPDINRFTGSLSNSLNVTVTTDGANMARDVGLVLTVYTLTASSSNMTLTNAASPDVGSRITMIKA